MDVGVNMVTYQRMQAAIRAMFKDPDKLAANNNSSSSSNNNGYSGGGGQGKNGWPHVDGWWGGVWAYGGTCDVMMWCWCVYVGCFCFDEGGGPPPP